MTQFVRAGAAVAAALLMLVGSTGCESFLAYTADQGTYVLESVGGRPLPALVLENEWSRVAILSDTVRLQSDGTGTKVYAVDVEYLKEPNRDGKTLIERRISYQLKGEAIEVPNICGPAELCTPPPHWTGRITADELRLDGAPGPYVYQRVDQQDDVQPLRGADARHSRWFAPATHEHHTVYADDTALLTGVTK
jgi:hypothetical protein